VAAGPAENFRRLSLDEAMKRTRIGIALLLALIGLALAPRAAKADYQVIECSPEQGQIAFPNVGLYAGGAYSIADGNDCGNTGFQLYAGPGYSAYGAWKQWQVDAPAGTRFVQAKATVHYGTQNGYGPMTISNGSPGYTGLSGGSGPNQWATPVQNNAGYFAVRMQCFASPCSPGWAYVYSTSVHAVVHDNYAPGITATGEMLDGGVVHGTQTLQANATDYGGGARSIAAYVNGIASKSTDFCPPPQPWGGQYTQMKPCPGNSGTQTFHLDTAKDPGWVDGPNDVRICSFDASGNVSSPCLRRTVYVDNSCPASGARQAAHLESGADVAGKLRSQTSVRSNQATVIRGSLTTSSGDAVSGATVCVYEKIDLADSSRELVAKPTTQSNGRFAAKLDPGASRKVELVYRYNAKTLEDTIKLDSTVVPTLRLEERRVHNGQKAHFKGGLPGPNSDNRAVALQARVGRKWRTFKQLKTGEDGAYRGLYRFTQTIGRARYIFRALVKRQSGYPYEPGASHKRKLFVHG
jgi:hypothetical protein